MAVEPFDRVLAAELAAVRERRVRLWVANGEANGEARRVAAENPPAADECDPAPADPDPALPLARQRQKAQDLGLVGLAFSGGGIRSGSVALGLLQGLARLRLLRAVDYLSTVSGGGYAGTWFAAWVYRECARPKEPAAETHGLANVERELDPSRVSEASATRVLPPLPGAGGADTVLGRQVVDQEPEPVHHVRAYSNYLTPRAGVFSLDTWTLIAIYLRNTLVNLLVLLLAGVVLVAASRGVVWLYAQGAGEPAPRLALTAIAVGFAACAVYHLVAGQAQVYAAHKSVSAAGPTADTPQVFSARRVLGWVILPVVAGSVMAVWALGVPPDPGHPQRYAGSEWLREVSRKVANG